MQRRRTKKKKEIEKRTEKLTIEALNGPAHFSAEGCAVPRKLRITRDIGFTVMGRHTYVELLGHLLYRAIYHQNIPLISFYSN